MFHIDEKHFMPYTPHCGDFPSEKPRYTMTEEVEHTAREMKNTIARLLDFEKRLGTKVDDIIKNITSDNVLFKNTFANAYNTFLMEVKNEVNVFEGNVDSSIALFRSNIESDYATLSEDCKKQIKETYQEYVEVLNSYKEELNELYDTFRDGIEERIQQNSDAFTTAHNGFCTLVNTKLATMEKSFNTDYANFTQQISNTISEFKTEWTRAIEERLDGQDAHINDTVVYIKTNLLASVGTILDEMEQNGELAVFIEGEVFGDFQNRLFSLEKGVYNVLAYGAIGDGSTDDTAAIQAAIDAAHANAGSTVYIPAGIYKISEPLVIYSHTRIMGAGHRGATESGYSGTQINYTGGDALPIITTNSPESTLFGIEIRDIRVNGASSIGVDLNKVSESLVENVCVNGGSGVGIYVKGTITNVKGAYVCECDIGLKLDDAHSVWVSNLNSWQNTRGVVISGSGASLTIRDSWIENSMQAIDFMGAFGGAVNYDGVIIENTSFTAGENFAEAVFIRANKSIETSYRLQGLTVIGCVVKIHTAKYGVTFNSPDYNIVATFIGNKFYTNNDYTAAVHSENKFNRITSFNNECSDYSEWPYAWIDGTASYLSMKQLQSCAELSMSYPIKLTAPTGEIQSYAEGQLYYKNGHLRLTDGSKPCVIPKQVIIGSGYSWQLSESASTDDIIKTVNGLITDLMNSGILAMI